MKTIVYALCVCLTVVSTARAEQSPIVQDAHIVAAMERIEARLGATSSAGERALGAQISRAVPGSQPIAKPGSGKTVKVMNHKVDVKVLGAVAKTLYKQKLQLKLKF